MKDITGKKFGRWTVIGVAERRRNGTGSRIFWECLCVCGNRKKVNAEVLKRGGSKSCGCLKKERPKVLPYRVPERNLLFRTYKNNAKRRNQDFFLTIEQFTEIISKDCFYCGIKPNKQLIGKGFDGQYVYNGVDRVNNAVGYVPKNCVPCCETCNKAKRMMSTGEFRVWIIRAYNRFVLTSSFFDIAQAE
jgi:hypothetical protein